MDSTDVMHIEYNIPFSILADATSLGQKTISVGFRINGVESSSANTVGFSTASVQAVLRVVTAPGTIHVIVAAAVAAQARLRRQMPVNKAFDKIHCPFLVTRR